MQEEPKKQRIVAIVGRPNVGKSAIFNRIIGRRVAIVHSESGVTRDRLIHEAIWHNQRFKIIDTGGLCMLDGSETKDIIQNETHKQVETALEDASIVLFVVDVQAGIMPMDEEVARMLRNKNCKVLLAANKADDDAKEQSSGDFQKFGYPVFAVSALHDRGFQALLSNIINHLPQDTADEEEVNPLKVAIIGRPNVGKSSFVNSLLGNDRVIVSEIAGTTRDSIDIPFQIGKGRFAKHYILIDTAGLRKTGKIDNMVEKYGSMRAEKAVERADIVLLIFDAVQGPTAFDRKITDMILEQRKGCAFIVNKWDLAVNKVKQDEYLDAMQKAIPFATHCPIEFVSAKERYNVKRCVETIDYVATQIRQELPTGILNRVVNNAYEKVNPPTVHGRKLKIYYSTQTASAPIDILLFVNSTSLITPAYNQYLINEIRKKFGLEGASVALKLRERKRKSL